MLRSQHEDNTDKGNLMLRISALEKVNIDLFRK